MSVTLSGVLEERTDSQMQSFSSLLSSLGDKPQARKPSSSSSNVQRPATSAQPARKPNGVSDRFKLTPNNAVAGVKRRSEEPDSAPKPKIVKIEQNGLPSRPSAAPTGRFQLSSKSSPAAKPSAVPQRPTTTSAASANPQRTMPKQPPKPVTAGTSTTQPANGSAGGKKGFAAMLERAKAADALAKAAGPGGIKHKAVEKLTRKERERLREEAAAKDKAAKKGQLGQVDRSRSGTPNGAVKPDMLKKAPAPETSYKGTMKKQQPAPDLPLYRGTMRAAGSAPKPPPKKGQAQDKYGGYASWSDLDDAEDEEEGYDESDDDMEGGFDDMEAEENAALRAARKEDQEALEEEERLKREKLARKKKLMELSKSAAARKRF